MFGLIGTFAHNLTRVVSFGMDQNYRNVKDRKTGEVKIVRQLGYFSKKVRSQVINIAGRIVRSARKIKLRIHFETKEVLDKIMRNLLLKLSLPS